MMTADSMRPQVLWYKARMPGVVRDGSSFASLSLLNCLEEKFDIDLLTLELTGRERQEAERPAPCFRSVTVARPNNSGSLLRRAAYKVLYGVRAKVRQVPPASMYEDCGAVRAAMRALLSARAYDLAVFEYWTSAGLLALARHLPTALILHDVAHYDVQRTAASTESGMRRRRLKSLSRRTRHFELRAISSARRAFALSEEDCSAFRQLGAKNIDYLPVVLPPLRKEAAPALRSSEVVFLGNLAHQPNRDAVLWFAQTAWPLIRERRPEATLSIIGGPLTEDLRLGLAVPGLRLLGHVPDLDAALRNAALGVSPMRTGTGTKTKVLDLMWRGVPLVVTRKGAPGTPAERGGALIADTPEQLAAGVVHLLDNLPTRLALRETAWRLLEDHHCGPAVKRRTQECFMSLLQASDRGLGSWPRLN